MPTVRRWLPWQPTFLLLGLLGLAAVPAPAATKESESEARLKKDVTYLASPECEGRGPLTKGTLLAADYIAESFRKAGLKPGGAGGSWFQPFTIPGAVLKSPPVLVLKGPAGQVIELKPGTHFDAMGLGEAGKIKDAPVVFAGYGLALREPKYDDYDGLDVAGKVVVALRGTPRRGGFFTRDTGKIDLAQKKKAAAVLLVNDAGAARDGDDVLAFDFTALSRSSAKLPTLHLRRSVLSSMLQATRATDLATVEADIARDMKPLSGELTGWTATVEVKMERGKLPLKNVVGVLEGKGPLAKETIVVGAHYDHLGYGSPSSRRGARKPAIHHGADDNASGTTAMMELARRFAGQKDREGRRLVFIAFSGEELGLLGSKYYCENPLFPLADTAAMYNLDMVGRLAKDAKTKKDKLLCEGAGTAKEFKELLDKAMAKYDFQLTAKQSGFGPSDHDSFCRKKIPVLFFWTGTHPDYHMPSDTADKINVAGMRRIVDMSEEFVTTFTKMDRPEFVVVKGAGPRRPGGRGPTLGIRPGYSEDDDGVDVESVTEGGPAHQAGMKDGDKIVSLAGTPVKNISAYMTKMAEQKRGSTVEVVVLRKGKKVTLKVELP